MVDQKSCIIIGAGPAGLTAAYELMQTGVAPILFEQDDIVGGISRTVEFEGYRFDIGGHRYFTKSRVVDDWWTNILEQDMLLRERLSRIYYNKIFFDYPLKPINAVRGLGPLETVRIGLSYLRARVFPHPTETNLEQWLCNRFGRRLYEIFFKSYTEKVWGMQCKDIDANWAAQRIKNLDLRSAVMAMFLGNKSNKITSLIEQFRYPRLGPGMMWEKVAGILVDQGYQVHMNHEVTRIRFLNGDTVTTTATDGRGNQVEQTGSHLISSMPIRNLINAIDPPAPDEVIEAANNLRYRDFLVVGLIINQPDLFPDNWIYIHSPDVKVGRIQNFKNWSPEMVPDPSMSSLGLEYFVQAGDELWNAEDETLIELGTKECAMLGLVNEEDIVKGMVIRVPKAYPIYDQSYKESLAVIRKYLDNIPNLQLVGRNGQHRYNNQDHSMLTAIYAARNIAGENLDVWDVNVDAEYHEQVKDENSAKIKGDRLVPQAIVQTPIEIFREAFARYDPIALGCALSVVFGLGLFTATAILLLQSGDTVGPHLSLLGMFFLGYKVTWAGAMIGLLEAAIGGFLLGFVMAHTINYVISWHENRLLRQLEIQSALEDPNISPPAS